MQELMEGNGGLLLHFHQYVSAHLGQSKQFGMIKHPTLLRGIVFTSNATVAETHCTL